MSSKYEGINTAAALVAEVRLNGLSLAQEDICRAQDIFGNTAIDELVRLANDIGRDNAQGEPDPEGTWSSGRKGTQGTFYAIVSQIWNWEEVTRFWNRYTNPQTKQFRELHNEHKKLSNLYDGLLAEKDELTDLRDTLLHEQDVMNDELHELQKQMQTLSDNLKKSADEVMRLKAKLYDLLVERNEAV